MCSLIAFLLGKKTFTRHSLASLTRIGSHDCDFAAREAGKMGNSMFSTFIVGGELYLWKEGVGVGVLSHSN